MNKETARRKAMLGMNPSTARSRLMGDLLWKFVKEAGIKCHRCGEEMCRETYTIEHLDSWMMAENPVEKYFDLDNITFSHHSCNSRAGRLSRHRGAAKSQ